MKKITYAICGATLVIVATVLRTIAGGGLDLALLVALGLVLLIASADIPQNRRVAR